MLFRLHFFLTLIEPWLCWSLDQVWGTYTPSPLSTNLGLSTDPPPLIGSDLFTGRWTRGGRGYCLVPPRGIFFMFLK